MSTNGPQIILRLPSPPKDYDQSHMVRMNNTLELDRRTMYFATSNSTKQSEEQSQAVSWFIG